MIRLIFGTVIATLFVPLVLYFPHTLVNTFIGKGIYSIFIIISTFGFQNIAILFKRLMMFYFVSFVIGGGLFALHYLLEAPTRNNTDQLLFYVSNIYGDQISLVILFIGFPILIVFTKIRMNQQTIDNVNYRQLYDVRMEWNGFCYDTIGFVDTGNHLLDPLTKRPVIICDSVFIKKYFDNDDWQALKVAILALDPVLLPNHLQQQIQLVPYQGVGGSTNYLFAIRPDKLMISFDKQLIATNKVLVGIQLANLVEDQQYHCLLHPELIYLKEIQTA